MSSQLLHTLIHRQLYPSTTVNNVIDKIVIQTDYHCHCDSKKTFTNQHGLLPKDQFVILIGEEVEKEGAGQVEEGEVELVIEVELVTVE